MLVFIDKKIVITMVLIYNLVVELLIIKILKKYICCVFSQLCIYGKKLVWYVDRERNKLKVQ